MLDFLCSYAASENLNGLENPKESQEEQSQKDEPERLLSGPPKEQNDDDHLDDGL